MVKSTNDKIFKSWVELYSGPLLKRAVYMLSGQADAEDAVQETFIAAISSYDSFEGKSQPLTWLMTILNRKIADFYRKKYKTESHIRLDHFFDETGSWKHNDVLKTGILREKKLNFWITGILTRLWKTVWKICL